MIISDPIYGEFIIDGVLEQLIQSQPIQRLNGIHQGGASYLVNPEWNVTRYEHSLGVMLLIKKLGGSLEEQVAGLLHDVSHTAFSHVIDFVFDNHAEDYHEKIVHEVVEKSEVSGILEQFGYDYKEILFNDSKWTLLEQAAPELCADRVDYTLRDMYRYRQISLEEARQFLDALIVVNGKMYLNRLENAEWFVQTYYKEVIDFFMDPLNIYGYHMLADTLKLALEKNIIRLSDLLGTDKEVLAILRSSNDRHIQALMKQIHYDIEVREDHNDFDIHRKNKVRLIDPSVLHGDELVRASLLSPKVKKMGDKALFKATEGMRVKIISN
ncbi:HD domain-containing protein [Bacillus gobiensis]|uniref:HD domain-containing protein n=1 Tax=Bacillus gobiensis TaxID=1441095 RepID=UPI003D1E45C3